jgi:hypothetical protein
MLFIIKYHHLLLLFLKLLLFFFFFFFFTKNNQHFYIDPETGYKVMTELYHKSRGRCCGSKCRHCPFNHENVGKNINLQDLINDDVKSNDENKK